MVKHVLFLCHGNVYRSQWAEGFFNHYNRNPGYAAKSAGMVASGMFEDSIERMREVGIDISYAASKAATPEMIDEAHIIYDLAGYFEDLPKGKLRTRYVKDPNGLFEDEDSQRRIRSTIETLVLDLIQEISNDA